MQLPILVNLHLISSAENKSFDQYHINSDFKKKFVVTILYWLYRVEFEDVHRLSDGQVKHSPEVFYAGSLWKVFKYMLGLSVHMIFYMV